MSLRDYQLTARQRVMEELSNGCESTLLVLPTGCGKTETFLHIARDWPQGDVLCLAHRTELVQQPFARWRRMSGEYGEMIMAQTERTRCRSARSRMNFASKDTLWRPERLKREFPDPAELGLIVIDEAHHAVRTNKTYQRIIDYFRDANPDLRVLGVTATPDRADEQALGQTFQSVAFDYPLMDPAGGPSAIGDGWLVPIEQEFVQVEEIRFDELDVAGGDFNEAALERQMIKEKALHKITSATLELAGDRPTIGFTAGVSQACMTAEIYQRHRAGSAKCLVSQVNEDEYRHLPFIVLSADHAARRKMLEQFDAGDYQHIVNCGCFTEGMDAPRIACISQGRPSKSRALVAQMVGRGTRILPNVIEGQRPDGSWWRLETAEDRRMAIAESDKPHCLVLDFVGNSAHQLVTTVDIFGGLYDDAVVSEAKKRLQSGRAKNVEEALQEAQRQAAQLALSQRARIKASEVSFARRKVDPFEALGVTPRREPGWHQGRQATMGQIRTLQKFKVEQHVIDDLSFSKASQLIDTLINRIEEGKCSYKQAKLLAEFGEPTDLSMSEASARIDRIKANGWKPVTN